METINILLFKLQVLIFIMYFQDVGVLDGDGQGPFNGTSEALNLHLSQV